MGRLKIKKVGYIKSDQDTTSSWDLRDGRKFMTHVDKVASVNGQVRIPDENLSSVIIIEKWLSATRSLIIVHTKLRIIFFLKREKSTLAFHERRIHSYFIKIQVIKILTNKMFALQKIPELSKFESGSIKKIQTFGDFNLTTWNSLQNLF